MYERCKNLRLPLSSLQTLGCVEGGASMTKAIQYYFVFSCTQKFIDDLRNKDFTPLEQGELWSRRYKKDSPEGKTILKLIKKGMRR